MRSEIAVLALWVGIAVSLIAVMPGASGSARKPHRRSRVIKKGVWDMSHDLDRFLRAQEPVYKQAMEELRDGQKRSHWMWFIFPQIAGLGSSDMARRYAIVSLDEARAYLAHPVLGLRLREFTALVMALLDKKIDEIFGYPDDLKFHSSMTLFKHAAPEDDTLFVGALDRFFDGKEDKHTLARLGIAE